MKRRVAPPMDEEDIPATKRRAPCTPNFTCSPEKPKPIDSKIKQKASREPLKGTRNDKLKTEKIQKTIFDCFKSAPAKSQEKKKISKLPKGSNNSPPSTQQQLSQSNENDEKSEKRINWLEDIKDEKGRSPNDPNYDETTLFIPENEFEALTDTRKQYWAWKRKHFDVILFFQAGYFLEIYGNDAILGVKLFDLKFANRQSTSAYSIPTAGVPTTYYPLYASKFVALGYKVAKMEQTVSNASANNMMYFSLFFLFLSLLFFFNCLIIQFFFILSFLKQTLTRPNYSTHFFGVCLTCEEESPRTKATDPLLLTVEQSCKISKKEFNKIIKFLYTIFTNKF